MRKVHTSSTHLEYLGSDLLGNQPIKGPPERVVFCLGYLGLIVYTVYMQLEQRMIKKGLYTLVSLGVIHVSAMFLGLYWIFPNFDIPMHFLGGVWLGFMATWFVVKFKMIKRVSGLSYLFWVAVVVLVVGLGWELFEYLLDQIMDSKMQPSLVDTQLDLVMDLLGGYIVALGILITQLNKENNG